MTVLVQFVPVFSALGAVALGSLLSDWLKDRRDRKRNQIADESIVAKTTVDLLDPLRQESAARLERIRYLKRVIRRLADYLDVVEETLRRSDMTVPPMPDDLREAVDEIEE